MVHPGWPREKTFISQYTYKYTKYSSHVRSSWRTHYIYDLRDSFLFCSLTLCRNIVSGCLLVSWYGTGDHQGLKEKTSSRMSCNVYRSYHPEFLFIWQYCINSKSYTASDNVTEYDDSGINVRGEQSWLFYNTFQACQVERGKPVSPCQVPYWDLNPGSDIYLIRIPFYIRSIFITASLCICNILLSV